MSYYIVISYDIVDDKKRNRVAKILLDYGRRVQKSVFECRVGEKEYLKIKERIEKTIDMNEDSVRYYFLCAKCQENIDISGWGTVTEDEETIIV
ncbi:MAG: CRISPR-associated endonuclease Cas2 [Deltaproteobacteria bacterium]|nr:CRISPR-associated endonuclease Cas2 [Deltaproteobacteria bacterium]